MLARENNWRTYILAKQSTAN